MLGDLWNEGHQFRILLLPDVGIYSLEVVATNESTNSQRQNESLYSCASKTVPPWGGAPIPSIQLEPTT